MTQKGSHTWDLILHYHCCPKCDRITESRQEYYYRLGRYIKELQCPYCGYSFIVVKLNRPSFAPLFGESDMVEVEW